MPPVLIDTNILVYLYDFNTPEKQAQARKVAEELHQTNSGRLSVQNLAEFLKVSTYKLKPPLTWAQALDQVSLFTRLWPVFDLTPQVVLEAARGARDHSLAYYDAQIWATAKLNQVPLIFSEDFSHGAALEGVRFANPFDSNFHLEDWV